MKRALLGGLAFFVLTCLSFPAWAQKGSHGGEGAAHAVSGMSHSKKSSHKSSESAERSNKGGAVRGKARAAEVQKENTKAGTERGFTEAPGLSQTTGKSAGQPKGKSSVHSKKPADAGAPRS